MLLATISSGITERLVLRFNPPLVQPRLGLKPARPVTQTEFPRIALAERLHDLGNLIAVGFA